MLKQIASALILTTLMSQSFAQSLDSVFNKPAKMTDEQARESKEFVHQGAKDRAYNEGCAQKGIGDCATGNVDPTGGKAVLEQTIAKMYTWVFGTLSFMSGGAKFEAKNKDGSKEEKNDYCMYGAMAYEMLSAALQSSLQKKAQSETAGISDPQLASLANLKEAHQARKKTATIQATAYGAVTACYVAYATMGGAVTDWKYWMKMGGAAALTTLYGSKAKKHADAAKKVQLVIDGMPKSGDCNPWTGTACFCKEPTSRERYPSQYEEVCVLNKGNPNGNLFAGTCGVVKDGKVEVDEQCKCKQNNSCFSARIAGVNPKFKLGVNFMNQANKSFDLLDDNIMDLGKLQQISAQTAAMASKVKPNVKTPAVKLNDEQKKLADSLDDLMPKELAAIAAVAPEGSSPVGGLMGSGTTAALEKVPESTRKSIADAQISGNYSNNVSNFDSKTVAEEFVLPQMPGTEQPSQDSTEVVSFAEQAVSNADVTKAPETPIFDIISNRYRRSGWTKLSTSDLK